MDNLWTAADWAGRVGLAALFIRYGVGHFVNLAAMTGYAQSKKVPAPQAAVVLTGVMQIVGVGMILLHWHVLWGCALLLAFLVPVALWMHDFWNETDPMARMNAEAHFWKNIGVASALLLYAVALHS